MPLRIEDYALIGDCETAVLLGSEENGCFKIAPAGAVVRIVQGLRGSVPVRMQLRLRFDFGRIVPWVSRTDHSLSAVAGPDMAILRTPIEHHGEDMQAIAEFTVREGDRVPFVLAYGVSYEEPPPSIPSARSPTRRRSGRSGSRAAAPWAATRTPSSARSSG